MQNSLTVLICAPMWRDSLILAMKTIEMAGAEGYEELFAVQAAVWRLTAGGHSAAHDLCISAPTGSGKTLAYALPIVSALLGCVT